MNDTVTYLLMTREGLGNVYYCLQRWPRQDCSIGISYRHKVFYLCYNALPGPPLNSPLN
jgi:hypothetical protein